MKQRSDFSVTQWLIGMSNPTSEPARRDPAAGGALPGRVWMSAVRLCLGAAIVLGPISGRAAEPVSVPKGVQTQAIKKNMSLVTLLGPGEFEVVSVGAGWVTFKNVKTQTSVRYRMNAGTFETGRKIMVSPDDYRNAGGTGSDLNCGTCRKECTVVSTGSSPGPADDITSCVCISSDGRSCRP